MAWIVLTVLLLLVAGVGLYLRRKFSTAYQTNMDAGRAAPENGDRIIFYNRADDAKDGRRWATIVVASAASLFVILTLFFTIKVVKAGNVKVVYQFGSIVGQLDEGVHMVAPWRTTANANIQTQREHFEKVAAVSAETQDVIVDLTVNYRVSPGAIQSLYRSVGADYFDRLVPSRVNQFVKDTTVQYATVDIAPNREKIKSQIAAKLATAMAQYSVDIVDVNIDNLAFSKEFTDAIEQKQVATQEAEREKQRVRQREFEGQQLVATAKAQAEANRLLEVSLTPAVIQKIALDIQKIAIEKLNPNVQVALIPSGSNNLLDVTGLLKKP